MPSIYLLCGLVGLGWSVINLILGQAGGHDAAHGDLHVGGSFGAGGNGTGHGEAIADPQADLSLPLFSPTAIAGYLTGFGATGYGLVGGLGVESPFVHVPASLVGAAALGLGVAWGTVKLLQAGETGSAQRRQALAGSSGELTVGIPTGGVGEVAFLVGGTRSTAPARSWDGASIPRGAAVRIVRADESTFVVQPAAERALAPLLADAFRD
ncbi:NfeD family protein [Vulgatibacter sp.]|uniref:NfeD family protein n=1 Tax=Vulgatibacter sp. TaxID=1971226 RepID=UPI00356A06E8